MNTWYACNTGSNQSLIIDEVTGANIAVSYDVSDAPLIAAAPDLLDALNNLIELFTDPGLFHSEQTRKAMVAISKARGE